MNFEIAKNSKHSSKELRKSCVSVLGGVAYE